MCWCTSIWHRENQLSALMHGMGALSLLISSEMFSKRLRFNFASAFAILIGIPTFVVSSLSSGSEGSAYKLGGYEMLLGI